MVPLEIVMVEVLGAINWGLWFFGLICTLGMVAMLAYTLYVGDSVEIADAKNVVNVNYQPVDGLSTGDILDRCLTHRSQLQYYHRLLCERAGVEPNSLSSTVDLITEAVYDGRNQFMCIKRVDKASQERKRQHA